MVDPLTYGVEGIRYGLTGISQVNPLVCFGVLGCFTAAMVIMGAYLFRKSDYNHNRNSIGEI